MVWCWFSGDNKQGEGEGVSAVGFVSRAIMGWFLGCFRIKDAQSHLVAPQEKAVVVSRNRNALSSLFISDDDSIKKGEEGRDARPERGLDAGELKDEAKFLKACGTLLETPVEIRKASRRYEDISAQSEEKLPDASTQKSRLDKQSFESPTPVQTSEEWVTSEVSLLSTPSCMTDGQNARRVSISSLQNRDDQNVITPINTHGSKTDSSSSGVLPESFAPSVQGKNKSVRFDLESDGSAFSSQDFSSNSTSQYSKQSGSSSSKPSPYPTPLKLTGEMQTPGTVFPAYMDDMANGKTARIRSQYVYSVNNPTENLNQRIDLKDENSGSDNLKESLKLKYEANLSPTPMSDMVVKDRSVEKERNNEASLSAWLRPPSSKQDDNNEELGSGSGSGEKVLCGRTPGDRPILGMVAVHWTEDETSHISPKWWGGNGIPNSTNKYKEDQKVSWHATPFEERLEKALSEETSISQRKPVGTLPVEFEADESDTALSPLQSSNHSKSVVSF